jgi:hypothetical protein
VRTPAETRRPKKFFADVPVNPIVKSFISSCGGSPGGLGSFGKSNATALRVVRGFDILAGSRIACAEQGSWCYTVPFRQSPFESRVRFDAAIDQYMTNFGIGAALGKMARDENCPVAVDWIALGAHQSGLKICNAALEAIQADREAWV